MDKQCGCFLWLGTRGAEFFLAFSGFWAHSGLGGSLAEKALRTPFSVEPLEEPHACAVPRQNFL
jgi:hypothetical protein